MLTHEEIQQFETEGFLRLDSAFSAAEAQAMEERVWAELEPKGVARDDPATFDVWATTGLQELRLDPLFQPIGSPRTIGAIDALLGKDEWKRPRHWGQFLITFPSGEGEWILPKSIWHTDYGFWPQPSRLMGLQVFSFLSDVPRGAGGTGIVGGSHRWLEHFVPTQPREIRAKMKRLRQAFMQSDPWLRELGGDPETPDRNARLMRPHRVVDFEVRAMELHGAPGDVVLTHPWLLHASSPNCAETARIMCVQRLHLREPDP